MSRAIVSSCGGDRVWDEISSVTWPRMRSFATKHGHSFCSSPLPAGIQRPPSWLKLVRIAEALRDYDEVLWLDADVVVVDESMDMIVPQSFCQAVVEHHFGEGDVPNSGVWLVRRAMLGSLMEIAMSDIHTTHKWWEQAALIEKMGYCPRSTPCRRVRDSELLEETFFLGEEWNCWTGSPQSVRPRFMHACGLTGYQRLDVIRRWAG